MSRILPFSIFISTLLMSKVFARNMFIGAVVLIAVLMLHADVSFAQEVAKEAGEAAKQTSFLSWIIKVSGPIGAFIFLLSVYFGTVAIRSFMEIRQSVAAPSDVVEACQKLIEDRSPRELVSLLQSDDSYFSQILLAGVLELKNGLDEARDKLDRKAEILTGRMEKSISILAVLGTLGPMIGLLGTLKGMIASFSVIAMSGVALDAGKVAEGISEALVITFEGVALSVPSIFLYSLFRNRISTISLETTILAEDHLRDIARMLKSKSPPVSDTTGS